jgi:hypothetical protein
MELVKRLYHLNGPPPIALFDASHGQTHWAQTGFPSRELHTNFAGLTEILCRRGFQCCRTGTESLPAQLATCRLLIIPPPTGHYDARKERWRRERATLFTREEVRAVLGYLHGGGRLLAFAYRFGDSFTQTNLGDLCLPLGCRLNDDAVIDIRALRQTDPLHLHFDTPAESLRPGWSRDGVGRVAWRPVATFTLEPGATAWPLALSTGGGCLSFDRTLRRICFASLPIAVYGHHGAGRFAWFGGPHLFESSPLGLLGQADNTRFLQNTLAWLLSQEAEEEPRPEPRTQPGIAPCFQALSRVEAGGTGERTIASVERVLRKAGVLKALSRAQWMP